MGRTPASRDSNRDDSRGPSGSANHSIDIADGKPVHLRAAVDFERLYLSYQADGGEWPRLPQQFDASILTDEAAALGTPNFTGAFVGMACQDMAGTGRPADFDYFEYRERAYRAML